MKQYFFCFEDEFIGDDKFTVTIDLETKLPMLQSTDMEIYLYAHNVVNGRAVKGRAQICYFILVFSINGVASIMKQVKYNPNPALMKAKFVKLMSHVLGSDALNSRILLGSDIPDDVSETTKHDLRWYCGYLANEFCEGVRKNK